MTTVIWKRTEDEKPQPGQVVETMSSNGQQQTLKYDSSELWFVPDESMYVYYTPEFWSPRS